MFIVLGVPAVYSFLIERINFVIIGIHFFWGVTLNILPASFVSSDITIKAVSQVVLLFPAAPIKLCLTPYWKSMQYLKRVNCCAPPSPPGRPAKTSLHNADGCAVQPHSACPCLCPPHCCLLLHCCCCRRGAAQQRGQRASSLPIC